MATVNVRYNPKIGAEAIGMVSRALAELIVVHVEHGNGFHRALRREKVSVEMNAGGVYDKNIADLQVTVTAPLQKKCNDDGPARQAIESALQGIVRQNGSKKGASVRVSIIRVQVAY